MVHYLKIKPEYYKDVECGIKTFELRKNDRNFQVGDVLMLIKLDDKGNETDQVTRVKVNYILKDCPQYGLKDGYAILGITKAIQTISVKELSSDPNITFCSDPTKVSLKGSIKNGER